MTTRPCLPLRYHGGKTYLAPWIVDHFPDPATYTHYCEPYFGGGSVLFARPPLTHSEVVNDLSAHLITFWRVLQRPDLFALLQQRLSVTPVAKDFFNDAHTILRQQQKENPSDHDLVELAWAFFVTNRQSWQGLGHQFVTVPRRVRRRVNEAASAWLSAIDGLPEIHSRLLPVVIENRDALAFIRYHDTPTTFFYLDPPYLHSTREKGSTDTYPHEMTEDDHRNLLTLLSTIKGRFVLSGYPSPLYSEYAAAHSWRTAQKIQVLHSSSRKEKPIRLETLWMNF
jgi:DNA adenine methylase